MRALQSATALSWNIWSFALFRFLTGAGIGGEIHRHQFRGLLRLAVNRLGEIANFAAILVFANYDLIDLVRPKPGNLLAKLFEGRHRCLARRLIAVRWRAGLMKRPRKRLRMSSLLLDHHRARLAACPRQRSRMQRPLVLPCLLIQPTP